MRILRPTTAWGKFVVCSVGSGALSCTTNPEKMHSYSPGQYISRVVDVYLSSSNKSCIIFNGCDLHNKTTVKLDVLSDDAPISNSDEYWLDSLWENLTFWVESLSVNQTIIVKSQLVPKYNRVPKQLGGWFALLLFYVTTITLLLTYVKTSAIWKLKSLTFLRVNEWTEAWGRSLLITRPYLNKTSNYFFS